MTRALSPAEERYVDACARFAHDVIAPLHARYDAENCFPQQIHDAARARGLLDAGLPTDLGGQGLGWLALARGGRVMARVCAPTTFTLGFNHGALRPVLFAGTDAQKDRLVKDTLARGGYASWCMTEKDTSGSNLMAIQTRAERRGDAWVVTGDKVMTGNGAVASLFFVLADTWDGSERLGPSIFAVPRGPGVSVGENTDKLGFRCLPTVDVSFAGVEVPADNLIGAAGDGLSVLVDSLDFMRFGGGIVILGLIEGALFDLVPWLEEREVYGGVRLVDDSHAQVSLGRLIAETVALEGLLESVALELEAGRAVSRSAAALKLLGSELALRATAEAMQWHGWRGIDGRFPTQKRFRDARQTSIYEGTNDVIAMNLFRAFLRERRA